MTTSTVILEQRSASLYQPPVCPHKDWQNRQREDFVPNQRQAIVLAAIQAGLDAKLDYSDDIMAFVITNLGITPQQVAKQFENPVAGGYLGMDLFYARDALRSQAAFAQERRVLKVLNPFVGQVLGSLTFNDFKRNTGMQVIGMSEDRRTLTLQGKRGRAVVTLECTPVQIMHAINRAAEKGARRDNFEQSFGVSGLFA